MGEKLRSLGKVCGFVVGEAVGIAILWVGIGAFRGIYIGVLIVWRLRAARFRGCRG